MAMRSIGSCFQPSERHPRPQATLCIWALAADERRGGGHLALSRDRWRIDRSAARSVRCSRRTAIAERGFSEAELAMLAPMRGKAFVGSAATVGAKIRSSPSEFELDEVVINTWAYDPAVRRRSYALIAEEFALS